MSARGRLLRLLGLMGALLCPLAIVLLLQIRPPLPTQPSSLSSPITLELVRGVLDLAAWGASLGLAALLLVHSLRALFAPLEPPRPPRRLDPPERRRPIAQTRLAAAARQGGFPPPFPLVPHPRTTIAEQPRAQAATLAPARAGVVAVTAHGVEVRPRAPARGLPAAPTLPPPSLVALGPLAITPAKRNRRGLRSQTRELLAYLALHPEGVTAEEFVRVFWPDLDDHKARKQLWRTVADARAKLGEVILRADVRYQLDRNAVAVDLDLFERLLAEADAAASADRQELLEQALALVRGEPLAGSDYPWAAGEIRHLRAMIIERLGQLGYLRLDDGNPNGALLAAEQAIAFDAYNEGAHRLAMHAEAVLGLREAIAERFEHLSSELDSRLGLEPDRETRLLYRRLLSQDADDDV
jgi:DNA-binding SARP family transcriptional activator